MLPEPGGLFQQDAGAVARLNAVYRAVDEVRDSGESSERHEAQERLKRRVGK